MGARLGRYGPYIAVAEPGRGVSGGAARDRFQGEEWRVATVKLQTFNEIRYVMHAVPAPPGPPAASGDEPP